MSAKLQIICTKTVNNLDIIFAAFRDFVTQGTLMFWNCDAA